MKRTACALIALLIFLSAAALAEDAAVSYSLTTGMPTDQTSQKLIAVLFDNDEAARPQAHMAEADVVYEAEISGDGRTAYTAIYNATVPETVFQNIVTQFTIRVGTRYGYGFAVRDV